LTNKKIFVLFLFVCTSSAATVVAGAASTAALALGAALVTSAGAAHALIAALASCTALTSWATLGRGAATWIST